MNTTGLPIKPPIPESHLLRHWGIYQGEIVPGGIFAWEPDLPTARELCVVTRVCDPAPPTEVKHATGTAFISNGCEPQVWTRPIEGGKEVNNDISRFREAVTQTSLKPQTP